MVEVILRYQLLGNGVCDHSLIKSYSSFMWYRPNVKYFHILPPPSTGPPPFPQIYLKTLAIVMVRENPYD